MANSWRRERWDSLRLLTPNWQSRLPGLSYDGADPDGYMTMGEVTEFIERFAKVSRAPVRTGVNVTSVRRAGDGYHVTTSDGEIACQTVVIASGACNRPSVPPLSERVPASVAQLTPFDYRDPGQLPDGGVLVVGASATGVQLAAEISRSGRPVTLCVGEHVRLPRLYRGRDVLWWMDAAGVWEQRYDEVDDLNRARRLPSPQLVGTPERATLDLNALTALGVRVVGRLAGFRDGTALFSGSLPNVCTLADLKLGRLLDGIDAWADRAGIGGDHPPQRFPATAVPASVPLSIDLRAQGIASVVWATGHRPELSWLHVPVFDRKGRVVHDGGVTAAPGLYLIGLPFLRRRKSSLIDGAAADAAELAAHLAAHLDTRAGRAPLDRRFDVDRRAG